MNFALSLSLTVLTPPLSLNHSLSLSTYLSLTGLSIVCIYVCVWAWLCALKVKHLTQIALSSWK